METRYLGLGDLLVIASEVLGVEPTVLAKVVNLVTGDSALHAPAAEFGGMEFYPEIDTKIAVLGYRLARNHPLPDGNKRTAFLAMIEFAERNGLTWRPLEDDDVVDTMLAVAAGSMPEADFVVWVSERLEPH
jgi:death on curing protein